MKINRDFINVLMQMKEHTSPGVGCMTEMCETYWC